MTDRGLWVLVPPAGLEPAAPGLGNRCSIHLSYGGYTSSGRAIGRLPTHAVRSLRVVFYQAEHLVSSQFVASLEEGEVNEEGDGDDLSTETADQLRRGRRGPARREQVVDDENALPLCDCVLVDLYGVRAVLEFILRAHCLGRELARLACRNETDAHLVRHGGAEDEPARLDAEDEVD